MPAMCSLVVRKRGAARSAPSRTTRSMTAAGRWATAHEAGAAHFDQPAMRRRRAADQPAVAAPTEDLVVGDQARKRAARRARSMSARPASSCPTPEGPRDQHAAVADMTQSPWRCRFASGRRGITPRPAASRRSARRADLAGLARRGCFRRVSEPPCASTICRLIDRPRPEFWPKPRLPAGRYRSARKCGRSLRRGCRDHCRRR